MISESREFRGFHESGTFLLVPTIFEQIDKPRPGKQKTLLLRLYFLMFTYKWTPPQRYEKVPQSHAPPGQRNHREIES